MKKASEEGTARFIAIGRRPYEDRSDEDHEFFQTFAKAWFVGQSDRKMMDHRCELIEAWNVWKENRSYYNEGVKRSSPYELMPESPESLNTFKAYAPSTLLGVASDPGGRRLTAAEQAGWASDEAYRQFLYRREEGNRWRDRARIAAKATVAGAVALVSVFGLRAALGTKKAAEKIGSQVQRIHREDEIFAKESVKNPHIALPRDLAKKR